MTNKSEQASYLMESEDEASRLTGKLRISPTEEQLRSAGLKSGNRAVELGCGSHLVVDLIARITGVSAVGVDSSESRCDLARQKSETGAEFFCAPVEDMPFADDEFDFVWSRFLFEYLSDPQAALREAVRITRPGGRVAVADLDAQLTHVYPLSKNSARTLEQTLRAIGSQIDITVGRKLPHFFTEVGLEDIRVEVIPHQVFYGEIADAEIQNWHQKLSTIGTNVIPKTTILSDDWNQLSEEVLRGFEDGSLFYYSILVLLSGRKPLPAT